MVEQLTVNQLVVGSSPTRGAKKNTELTLYFFWLRTLNEIRTFFKENPQADLED